MKLTLVQALIATLISAIITGISVPAFFKT